MSRLSWKLAGTGMVMGLVMAANPSVARAHDEAHEHDGQHRAQMLTKTLKLNDAQKTQVQQIAEDYKARRQQLKDQLKALQQEENGKVRAILTPDQQAKFDQMQQRMAKRHEEAEQHEHGRWHGGENKHSGS